MWLPRPIWRFFARFRDAVLGVGAFALIFAGGRLALDGHALQVNERALLAAVAFATVIVLFFAFHRQIDRFLADGLLEPAAPIGKLGVIDGDTFSDQITGVRYRLQNVDCPETEERARCAMERSWGHVAKLQAKTIVAQAQRLSVRRSKRVDQYGRRIARILVDGKDLGKLLIADGVAVPWRGKRERWCGTNGGLAQLAKRRGQVFACEFCSRRR
jgi:endonuclease YncB( thermonuclease family)